MSQIEVNELNLNIIYITDEVCTLVSELILHDIIQGEQLFMVYSIILQPFLGSAFHSYISYISITRINNYVDVSRTDGHYTTDIGRSF